MSDKIYIVGTRKCSEPTGSSVVVYGIATTSEDALLILHQIEKKVPLDSGNDESYEIWERGVNTLLEHDWIG